MKLIRAPTGQTVGIHRLRRTRKSPRVFPNRTERKTRERGRESGSSAASLQLVATVANVCNDCVDASKLADLARARRGEKTRRRGNTSRACINIGAGCLNVGRRARYQRCWIHYSCAIKYSTGGVCARACTHRTVSRWFALATRRINQDIFYICPGIRAHVALILRVFPIREATRCRDFR